MQSLCKKESVISFSCSASPYFAGCPPWGNSTESHVEQSSISRSLSLKMGVPPQHSHNTKQLNFQFHDQDSSSSQSTGESYPEVASMRESNHRGEGMVSPQLGLVFCLCFLELYSFVLSKFRVLLDIKHP